MKKQPKARERIKEICSLLSILDFPKEMFMSIDNFPIWREHIVYCVSDGKRVREIMTQRFSSNMVFLSLLLSVEVGVLFSPSDICTAIRCSMNNHCTNRPIAGHLGYETDDEIAGHLAYETDDEILTSTIGIVLVCNVVVTMIGILATFTAWGLLSAVGDDNTHFIVRSSVGLFATQLPSRLLISSLYMFLCWMIMILFELLPNDYWAISIAVFAVVLTLFVVSLYSSLGRLIIHTKAMNSQSMFNVESVDKMNPFELTEHLVALTRRRQTTGKSASETYRYSSVNVPSLPQSPRNGKSSTFSGIFAHKKKKDRDAPSAQSDVILYRASSRGELNSNSEINAPHADNAAETV
mmetsp:Transcript_34239/g.49725  ORF Transcript_34239/g.49725 Transcript_34239/m.49725 type:complete len:352 (-) Transcript_34239:558-1613(-)|eukprot:CAMPEP_0116009622 /NCGR_PEP_ID=MMETSP0321-20121206/3535_1 /TAXON_ID=163516 /ORGANISM="Leptocylindrus danicus var. danicus, Strain B650" /LENGTH=351 /DNA_ID=CAMNT_0003478605 /DNA_START=364 /DNA_END=1419 /DNA_ORIENTATION=-